MVDPQQVRDVSALQALDDKQVPWRPVWRQRQRHQPGDLGGQLPMSARSGEDLVMEVIVYVELGIVVPVLKARARGDLAEPPAQRRDGIEPVEQALPDRGTVRSVRRAVPVEDEERANETTGRRRVDGQEHCVETAESLHLARSVLLGGHQSALSSFGSGVPWFDRADRRRSGATDHGLTRCRRMRSHPCPTGQAFRRPGSARRARPPGSLSAARRRAPGRDMSSRRTAARRRSSPL